MTKFAHTSKPIRPSTRESLLRAGLQIFSKNPKARLAEVALAAGVGRATLHRHFKGRDDLMHALAAQALEELEKVANEAAKGAWSYTNALHKIFTAIIPMGERHWFLMNGVADNFPDIEAKLNDQNNELLEVIKKAGKEGLYPRSCPPEWVMTNYDLMIYGAWQMVRDGHLTQKQAAKLTWNTFVAGMKKAKL